MWTLDTKIPEHCIITDGTRTFICRNEVDAAWLCEALDELTNTVVKLYCLNQACKGYGGFISRTTADAKKTAYPCDECGKLMTRKPIGETPTPKAAELPRSMATHAVASDRPLVNKNRGEHLLLELDGVPSKPALQAVPQTVPSAVVLPGGTTVFPDEARFVSLEARVLKLEQDSVLQAEAFQALLAMMEEASAQKAKT